LFDYLASEHCTLFSIDVKLSNKSLDLLLSECSTAQECIEICHRINDASRQFTGVPALQMAIREEKEKIRAAAKLAPLFVPAPWITSAHRDA
jgi:hypothetical protein